MPVAARRTKPSSTCANHGRSTTLLDAGCEPSAASVSTGDVAIVQPQTICCPVTELDGGAPDGGTSDSGTSDSGTSDGAAPDGGVADAG